MLWEPDFHVPKGLPVYEALQLPHLKLLIWQERNEEKLIFFLKDIKNFNGEDLYKSLYPQGS